MFTPLLLVINHQTNVPELLQQRFPDALADSWRTYNTTDEPLTVDSTRLVLEQFAFIPTHHTTYIVIHQAEKLSNVIQNTLLKSLEEPPEHLQFILLTTDVTPLLPTVVSRCQVVYGAETVIASAEETERLQQLYQQLQKQSISEAIKLVEEYSERSDAITLVDELLRYLTQRNHAQPNETVVQQLQKLLITREQLHSNVNVKLALESCFFALRGQV